MISLNKPSIEPDQFKLKSVVGEAVQDVFLLPAKKET